MTYFRHFLTKNKSNISSTSVYYRHATTTRNSSYPYISGDTFRAFADYIYDETRHDNLNSVQYGDIVFVKSDMIAEFFHVSFNSITKSFVLVTHNSDRSAPVEYQTYLSQPKILQWYASNPSHKNLQKLIPIPIGLANTRWSQGNLDKISTAFQKYRKPWSQRTSFLYVNFSPHTNPIQRRKAYQQASTIKNVQIIKSRISFDTYLEHIGNTKFVLSPPGNGLDCHRTWEALLMGAIPIVLTSGLDPLFKKTQSIIVDDWSNVTLDFLLSFNFSLNDHLVPNVIYAQYWHETLLKHRTNFSSA
ncbi:hypothetical protein I4U23_002889 [Adineta vaga]|nr:hypothetical protein I4U23_002889 [Adineta vaga]